jgi:hypothetical protein
MAESYIQLPADSSGKKAHTFQRTIGSNTVEDEILIQGEPYLATYWIDATTVSTATANSHLLQIMAGASLRVYVRRITITQHVLATTAALSRIQIFRLSTAGTGGTAITPAPSDPADAASGATAMTLPTVKGTETTNVMTTTAMFLQALPATASGLQVLDLDFTRNRQKSLVIAAGTANGIAVKLLLAIAAGGVTINAEIAEANF